jgi:hypothetical protein
MPIVFSSRSVRAQPIVAVEEVFDFYISPTGTGSAASGGSIGDPWSITMINNATARTRYAGKKVGMMDGTYGLITLMGQPSTTGGASQRGRLRLAGGSVGSPTILKSVNVRQAVIDWERSLQSNNSMESSIEPGGDYVTFDGIVFDNNNYQCIVNNPGGGSGYDFMTVKNCLFRNQSFEFVPSAGQNSAHVYSQGGSHILITNCRFEGGNAINDLNRHNNIMFYTPTVDGVIEYCTFISEVLGTDVIHWKQQGATDSTVRYCYIDRSAVTQTSQSGYCFKFEGVTDAADTASVYGNVIISGGSTARSLFHAEPGTAGTYDFHNNTLIGPWTTDGGISSIYSRACTQFNCDNNIFHRVSGTGGTYGDVNVYTIGTIGTMDYNYYSSAPKITVGNLTNTYTTLASWRAASSRDANAGSGSDPLFVGSGSEASFYKLQGGSPCKTLGAGGTEIGAWAGQSAIGSNF